MAVITLLIIAAFTACLFGAPLLLVTLMLESLHPRAAEPVTRDRAAESVRTPSTRVAGSYLG